MRYLPNVILDGVTPDIMKAITAADFIMRRITGAHVVVTSGIDGVHMKNSKHYIGEAVDVRNRNLSGEQNDEFIKELKIALGKDYDIVLERDHIHIEHDPKG